MRQKRRNTLAHRGDNVQIGDNVAETPVAQLFVEVPESSLQVAHGFVLVMKRNIVFLSHFSEIFYNNYNNSFSLFLYC